MKWKHQRLESSKKTGQEQLESQAGDSTDCVLKRRTVLYTATEQDLLSRITAAVWNDFTCQFYLCEAKLVPVKKLTKNSIGETAGRG